MEIFTSAPDLRSRYGECEDCPAARVCKICPLTLLEFTPGRSPRRVPAFLCAWYRFSYALNREFPALPRPEANQMTLASIEGRRRYWAARHAKGSPKAAAPGDPQLS